MPPGPFLDQPWFNFRATPETRKSATQSTLETSGRCPYFRLSGPLKRQLALQICEHLSQSVTDLSSFLVYGHFHSNLQRSHRCGGLVFWTQVVLAVRGRDRVCGGSGARAAPGPGTICPCVADNCAPLRDYRRVARAVLAKNCHRSAWFSRWRQARGRDRCGVFRALCAALGDYLCDWWNYWRHSSACFI